MRVIKYIRRGYSIQVKSLGSVCARLYSGIEPGSAAIYDEDARATVLAGLLREGPRMGQPANHSYSRPGVGVGAAFGG